MKERSDSTSLLSSGSGSGSNSTSVEESQTISMAFKQLCNQVFLDVVSYISEYGILKYVSTDIQQQIQQYYQLINEYDIVLVAKHG